MDNLLTVYPHFAPKLVFLCPFWPFQRDRGPRRDPAPGTLPRPVLLSERVRARGDQGPCGPAGVTTDDLPGVPDISRNRATRFAVLG